MDLQDGVRISGHGFARRCSDMDVHDRSALIVNILQNRKI